MNDIIISFDQQAAVRVSDCLKLVAVPEAEGRCVGCEAGDHETRRSYGGKTCKSSWASDPLIRCCNSRARKDGRNIVWKPVSIV